MKEQADDSFTKLWPKMAMIATAVPSVLVLLGSLFAGCCCAFFGFDPLLRLFGIVAINQQGLRASRLRLLARCFLAWGPLVAGSVILLLMVLAAPKVLSPSEVNAFRSLTTTHLKTVLIVMFIAISALLFVALRWPDRSLADRLVGTWLVPE